MNFNGLTFSISSKRPRFRGKGTDQAACGHAREEVARSAQLLIGRDAKKEQGNIFCIPPFPINP